MRFKSLMGGFIGATLLMGVLCAAASIEQKPSPIHTGPVFGTNSTCSKCALDLRPPRPRFERVYTEGDDSHNDTSWALMEFRVFHDKETGQEIVCTVGHYNARSCWLTGRVW